MATRSGLRSGGAAAPVEEPGNTDSTTTDKRTKKVSGSESKARERRGKKKDDLEWLLNDNPGFQFYQFPPTNGALIDSTISHVSGLTGTPSNSGDRVCYSSVKTRFLNILLMTRSHSLTTFHVPQVNHHFVTLSNTTEPRASGKSMIEMFSASFDDGDRKENEEHIRSMLKGVVLSCFVIGSPSSASGGLDLFDIESGARMSSSSVAVLVKPTPHVVELLSINVSDLDGLAKFCRTCCFSLPSDLVDYRAAFLHVQNEYQLRPGAVFFAPVEGAHRTYSSRCVMMNTSIKIDFSRSMLNDEMVVELTDELDAAKLIERSQKIVASIMSSVIQSTGDHVGSLLIAVVSVLEKKDNFIYRYESASSKTVRTEHVRADAFKQMRAVSLAVINCLFPSLVKGVPEKGAVHHELLANLFRAILIPKDGDYKKNFATLDIDHTVSDPIEQMRQIGKAFRVMVAARIKAYGWIPHNGNEKLVCCIPKELKGLMQVIILLIGSGASEEPFTNQIMRGLFFDLPHLYSFCFDVNCLVQSANDMAQADRIDVIYSELVIFRKLLSSISERLRSPDNVSVRSVLIEVRELREKIVSLNMSIRDICKLSRVDKLSVVRDLWNQRTLVRADASESESSAGSKATARASNRGATVRKSSSRRTAISFDVGNIQPPKKQRVFKSATDANRSAIRYLEVMKGAFEKALSEALVDESKAVSIVNGLGESVQSIFSSDYGSGIGGDSSALLPDLASATGSSGGNSSSAAQNLAASTETTSGV